MLHLPGPEEPILQRVHAGERELLETILDRLVPLRMVHPITTVTTVAMRSTAHTIDPQTTVVDRVAELARDRDAELLAALVHKRTPRVAGARGPDANWVKVRLAIERDIRVRVEDEAVCSREEARPLGLGLEAVVDADVRAVTLTDAGDATDNLVRLVVAARI